MTSAAFATGWGCSPKTAPIGFRLCRTRRDPFDQASLFYDDRDLMKTRIDRLEHPRIHVQTPPSRTAHLVGNTIVEQADEAKGEYLVSSTFIMVEYRDDQQRIFAGRQHHRLAPRRRELPDRPEAGRPDQLRQRVRGDGGADLTGRSGYSIVRLSDFASGAQRAISAAIY